MRPSSTPWRARYEELAVEVQASAPGARPALISTTADVDDIYVMTAAKLRSLGLEGPRAGGLAAELAAGVSELVAEGRDGELFWDWPEGLQWLGKVIGPPDRVQVGGTGPQAAWALDVLGAPSVMALESRSRAQLCVLAPGILICSDGRMVPAGELRADEGAVAVRNQILEFPAGNGTAGSAAGRAHRIIVRFMPIALERDEDFMAMQERLGADAGAGVLSGLNGLAVSDGTSRDWVRRLLGAWREYGPRLRHVELGDTTRPSELKTIMADLRGFDCSLGMSLSELMSFWGGTSDVAAKALELAGVFQSPCVVVHADRWSLAVHRVDPVTIVRRLMTGNLLASARAATGAPRAAVVPANGAIYSQEIPGSGPLGEGWRVDCVPAPFVAQPRSTIGLGDTFTAGLLLAAGLEDLSS